MKTCPECGGLGEIRVPVVVLDEDGKPMTVYMTSECPYCNGDGQVEDDLS